MAPTSIWSPMASSAPTNGRLTPRIGGRLGPPATFCNLVAGAGGVTVQHPETVLQPHMPDFRILGPLEVSDVSGPLLLGGQKQRAVLALLLLEPGRVVSTDRLVDALWGERPPRTAGTSLQNFISQLRRVLGPEILETKPPGYRLRVRPGELDLDRFRSAVEQARTRKPPERARKLREALALWRGPPLADFTFEAFAQPHIMHLEELRLSALEERVQADLETGRHAELVGELEALVQQHPVRERLRGHYMLALYRSGRQAEALQ